MNRDLRFEELEEYANEFACSIAEAARDIVFDFLRQQDFGKMFSKKNLRLSQMKKSLKCT